MSKVIDAINNQAVINDLLEDLNEKAREQNSYEYGLPIYSDEAMSGLREVVLKWLVKHEAAEQNMHQTGLTLRQKEEVEQIVMRAISTGSV